MNVKRDNKKMTQEAAFICALIAAKLLQIMWVCVTTRTRKRTFVIYKL